ncbi:MAG: hypothetical protein ABJO27_17585 [Pseudoruegeria sp.]
MPKSRVAQPQKPTHEHIRQLPSDAHWQKLTHAANSAFYSGERQPAQKAYAAALIEAERLLVIAENAANPGNAATILVISHHNLAELAVDAGQTEIATHHFQAPFDRLLSLARKSSTPSQLRQSCITNLKEATIGLVTHLQTKGAPITLIADTIKKAKCVANGASRTPKAALRSSPRLS